VLKFGDRTQIGAVHLATSLVADLHLIAAAILYALVSDTPDETIMINHVVALSGGALLANIVSVILLIAETINLRR
jgi:hypothetical protein